MLTEHWLACVATAERRNPEGLARLARSLGVPLGPRLVDRVWRAMVRA